MSAIAYITDSKMLELHRLNNHQTMNFWRVSSNINFSEFGRDDLVFFLSKDKVHRKHNEKGVVGFGRLNKAEVGSIRKMWEKYGDLNGYNSLEEFKEAIRRVSKDHSLPRKISSFYLENVVFFQPVYLSECGMKISDKVESYIYLKNEETVLKLLELAERSADLWSSLNDNARAINKEKQIYSLLLAHEKTGDLYRDEKTLKRANRIMNKYLKEHEEYRFVGDSECELFTDKDNSLEIVIYKDKKADDRLLIGHAYLYHYYLNCYCKEECRLKFSLIEADEKLENFMNMI